MSSWLNGLMTKAVSGPPQTAANLVQRLQNAHSQEEKRNAVADLKSMADDTRNAKVCQSQ